MLKFAKPALALGMLVLWSTHAWAQDNNASEWFVGHVGFAPLLSNDVILAELHVSDQQAQELRPLLEAMRSQQQEFRQNNQGLPKDELETKGLELSRTLTLDLQKGVVNVLKPEQLRRLTELQIQYVGAVGFTTTQVQKALGMTDEQKKRSQEIVDEMSRNLREMAKADDGDPTTRRQRSSEQHMMAFDKSYALLTAPQKAAWMKLTGKPFLKPFERKRL